MPKRKKTEAQKAQAREYQKRTYWANPEKFRAESNEHGKRKRAEDKAAGIAPKPRRSPTAETKAKNRENAKAKYWSDPEKHRTQSSEYLKRQRRENPDELRAKKRAYYWAHREEILASQSAYREATREARRASGRARIDPEENRARVKTWRAENPAKARANKLRRRARQMNAPVNDFTAEQWLELLDEFNGGCAYCPAAAESQDHMTPLVRGGGHTASNIVPACKRCNSKKNSRTLFEFVTATSADYAMAGAA